MKLPQPDESIKPHFNERTRILETQAVLFAPTEEVWKFVEDVKADIATVMSAGGRLPYQYVYFSFANLGLFGGLKPLFPGALCEQLSPHKYAIHYIYIHRDNSWTSWFPYSVHVDMETGLIDDLYEVDWSRTAQEDVVDQAIHLAAKYIIKLIAILNCKNLFFDITVEKVSETVNRKRAKKGKQPLYEHRVLDIDFCKQGPGRSGLVGGSGSAMRAHLVRGHFKQRKTGLFWWSPFARGNANHGIVNKEYSLSKTS